LFIQPKIKTYDIKRKGFINVKVKGGFSIRELELYKEDA